MRIFKQFLFLAVIAVITLPFLSCSAKKPEHSVSFYLELPRTSGVFETKRIFTLPVSEKQVLVAKDPVFNIDAFSDCIVVEKFDDGLGVSFPGIFFRIKDEYEIRLKQIASRGNGLRFILVSDGKPLGFCNITTTLSREDLFFYIETLEIGDESRQQLEDLSFILNSYILEFREYRQKK